MIVPAELIKLSDPNRRLIRRPRALLLLLLCLLFCPLLPLGFHADAQAQDSNCGWATAKKWKVKMHLTQVLNKQGVLQSGPDCTANYTLALNHVSDVTGTFSSTGTGGAFQGSLASQETVNNTMDIIMSGRAECAMGNVTFSEIGTGTGSEDNVSLSIDPGMGKYTIAFPHTGINTTFVYDAPHILYSREFSQGDQRRIRNRLSQHGPGRRFVRSADA
jgi:hypothetical protein